MRTTLLIFCVCVASAVMADPTPSVPALPAKQTLVQIADLPANATFADLKKLVGDPGPGLVGETLVYYFRLDDGSWLTVRVRPRHDSIESITHQSSQWGTKTHLFPKPTPAA